MDGKQISEVFSLKDKTNASTDKCILRGFIESFFGEMFLIMKWLKRERPPLIHQRFVWLADRGLISRIKNCGYSTTVGKHCSSFEDHYYQRS